MKGWRVDCFFGKRWGRGPPTASADLAFKGISDLAQWRADACTAASKNIGWCESPIINVDLTFKDITKSLWQAACNAWEVALNVGPRAASWNLHPFVNSKAASFSFLLRELRPRLWSSSEPRFLSKGDPFWGRALKSHKIWKLRSETCVHNREGLCHSQGSWSCVYIARRQLCSYYKLNIIWVCTVSRVQRRISTKTAPRPHIYASVLRSIRLHPHCILNSAFG